MKKLHDSIASSVQNAHIAIECFPKDSSILAMACRFHESIAMAHIENSNYEVRAACASHESAALLMLESDERVLLICVTHEKIAEKIAYTTCNERILAQCVHHQSIRNIIEDRLFISIPVLEVLIEYDEELARQYYTHSNPKIRRACAKHPAIAKFLTADKNSHVLRAVAAHHEIALKYFKASQSIPFITECAKHADIAEQLYKHESAHVRAICAIHETIARHLINDSAWIVRKACAMHEPLVDNFITDPNPLVRAICTNTTSCVEQLIKDNSSIVLKALSQNEIAAPKLVAHTLKDIALDAQSTVSYWKAVA